jgi:hypothetical protein
MYVIWGGGYLVDPGSVSSCTRGKCMSYGEEDTCISYAYGEEDTW